MAKEINMKKNFTMHDFEEGLMLAGKVPPANESDRRKLRMLKKYEDQKPKNLYVKLRK